MRVGVVVLTTGARPAELAAALASVEEQRGVELNTVVVVNREGGTDAEFSTLPGVGDSARLVLPGRNLGIPAGRNLGVAELGPCELVLFLDDDATLVGDDVLARAVEMFAADPLLGAISMRITDARTGVTERHHVPRLRVGDPRRSSWVTTLLGGATVARVAAYHEVGGLPDEFFYAHEETSLAWRLLDRGYRLRYAAELEVHHPEGEPTTRHAEFHHFTARNRVLLARKHLPLPVAVLYLAVWTVLGLLRSPGGRRETVRGFVAGMRATDVERSPIGWATVGRMIRYGRPPII